MGYNFNFKRCLINSKYSICCLVAKTLLRPHRLECQAPLSIGFPRQGYWNALPFPSPGDLPNQGIKPDSPTLQGRHFTIEPPGNFQYMLVVTISFIVSTFFSCSSKKMSGCYTQVISATGRLLLMSSSLPSFFILPSFFLSDPVFRSQLSSHLKHPHEARSRAIRQLRSNYEQALHCLRLGAPPHLASSTRPTIKFY